MIVIILESKRLYLKEFTNDNEDNLFRLNGNADVMKYIRPPETDINIIKKLINKIIKYYRDNPGLGVWAGYEKQSDKFIGFFELAHLDTTDEIEVGYRLFKEYWGKGYATEMTKVLIDYGFNTMGLNQIAGITHPENFASQNVLLKSGLTYIKDAVFYGFLDRYYTIDSAYYQMNIKDKSN